MNTRRWISATALIMLAASALTACGGSDKKSSGGLEKTNLTVATLPTPDAATLYLAIQKGYFKAEGLNVKPSILGNGADIVNRVVSGNADFADSGYIPIILAASNGVKLRVVVDAYQGRSKLYPIMTLPSSGIHDAKGLAGKKIGIINTKGFPALLTQSALQSAGLKVSDVKYVEVQLPAMAGALKNHSIDAAFMSDPWVSQLEQQLGARQVVDTMSGPTADLAVGGYIASQRFAQKNPKTVAAFQRAMAKAQADAQDRNQISQVLPTFIKGLSPQTAQTINLGSYPVSLNKTRLQRVADLMTQYGQLKQHYDVQPLLG
jgi:NitT/TauT family transport system substrate-binding protein